MARSNGSRIEGAPQIRWLYIIDSKWGQGKTETGRCDSSGVIDVGELSDRWVSSQVGISDKVDNGLLQLCAESSARISVVIILRSRTQWAWPALNIDNLIYFGLRCFDKETQCFVQLTLIDGRVEGDHSLSDDSPSNSWECYALLVSKCSVLVLEIYA